MGAKELGARVKRVEDPALVTGRGNFVADVKLPGMLHAAFVRTPYAHARLRSIQTGRAQNLRGVRAVFTASDLPPRMLQPLPMDQRIPPVVKTMYAPGAPVTQACLAAEEVCYVGQAM